MSKEIFVAFATQKGGIGKSTVTALAASYLHNVMGLSIRCRLDMLVFQILHI